MRILWYHAGQIIDTYAGKAPLPLFLKKYYRNHPKLGSRDRRALNDMAYAWYRCSKALQGAMNREQKILACLFLCDLQPKALEKEFPGSWVSLFHKPVGRKMELLQKEGFAVDPERIFSYDLELSEGITRKEWIYSMLDQPLLFLRIPKKRETITSMLRQYGISGQWLTDTCLALPNGTNIEKVLPPDSYMVQDASSQATGAYFRPSAGETWWDCCCGAGGKSLLLTDLQPDVALTASDLRESILQNLLLRFRQYHHRAPKTLRLDMEDEATVARIMGSNRFNVILCDVPCTGSGTWARTPEQLYFFSPELLTSYSARQQSIVHNASGYLKDRGRIIYITCSVFREENENVVEKIAAEEGLIIESAQLINGISQRADSLFVAVLKKKA